MPAQGIGNAPIPYEITLEPHQQRWLLTLEATLTQPEAAVRRMHPTADLQWLSMRPVTEVLRYRAQAHLHYVYGQQLPPYQRQQQLQLPAGLNPRTAQWAQTLRTQYGSDDTAIVQAALAQLGNGQYVYSLQPGEVQSVDTADDFWFERQKGFCEHIASAFVVLMRSAGIPARIVAGYQGGERNDIDGLWTVRQSDAHAWAEVWIAGEGWLRIDPTTAVAPARTEQLQRLQAPATLLDNTVGSLVGLESLHRLRANWEALNHRWNDWVLNYSRADQNDLLRHLGLQRIDAAKAALWLSLIVAAVMAGFWLQRQWRRRQPDPWLRLMHAARHQMAQGGITPASSLGPRALAHAAQAQWGDESQPLQKWLLQMEQWRYAPHGQSPSSLAALRRDYRALKWPRPRTR